MATKTSKRARSTLRSSTEELKRVLAERERLARKTEKADRRIAQIAESILVRTDKIMRDPKSREITRKHTTEKGKTEGLTSAIRSILKRSEWLSPPQVREELKKEGIDLSDGKQLIKIHVVLKRLVEKGEVEMAPTGSHKNIYKWRRRIGA